MTTNNKISSLISSQVPFFVRNDHPNVVLFLEKYYEFLEQNGQTIDGIKNLTNYADIDRTTDVLAERFYNYFLTHIPNWAIADKRLILKHVKDFYLARGTERSIQFLINILFGQETNFYYPKQDILRASDGRWFIEKSIKIRDVKLNGQANDSIDLLNYIVDKTIKGNTSNATAVVEAVSVYYEKLNLIKEIKLSNQSKDFSAGEEIFTTFTLEGNEYSLTGNVFSGFLNSISLANPGSGYAAGQSISVESDTGNGAIVVIDAVSRGNIKSLSLVYGGAGFQVNDPITITGGDGVGANAYVLAVDTSGAIHPNSYNVIISNVGSYATNTINTFANNTFSNAGFEFAVISLGPIIDIKIVEGGENYLTIPTIDVTPNTLIRNLNILGRMQILDGGTGYVVNNHIEFINQPDSYGFGANAIVTEVDANGTITKVAFKATTIDIANTSNLTISTGEGDTVSTLNLSQWVANSNVSIAVGDRINVYSTVYNQIVSVTSTDASSNVIVVDPGVSGNLVSNSFTVIKTLQTEITGGSGYTKLPTANVISDTGSGAYIVVTSVLGDGEIITATTDTIGKIEKLRIAEGGSGYLTPPTIRLDQYGDGKAQAVASIITGIFSYPGRFIGDSGLLSSHMYLQDGSYYHNYSYVVRTPVSLKKYKKPLTELIHPSGLKLFADYIFEDRDGTINVALRTANTSNYSNLMIDVIADKLAFTVGLRANTSNLTLNTGEGNIVTTINLSHWAANSNVAISANDGITVNGKTVIIQSISNEIITIEPGLSGNIVQNSFSVIPYSDNGITESDMMISYNRHPYAVNDSVFIRFADNTFNNYNINVYSITSNSFNIVYPMRKIANSSANGNVFVVIANGYFNKSFVVYPSSSANPQNTSNLFVNTGMGALVTTINLSSWAANSNVEIKQYDRINVNNKVVLVTSVNPTSNILTVSPGISGNLSSNQLYVIKDNVNTSDMIITFNSHPYEIDDTLLLKFDVSSLQNTYVTVASVTANTFNVKYPTRRLANGNVKIGIVL